MPTSNDLPELITKQNELDALCELVDKQTIVALDTEFVRTSTYAPHLGLLQIQAGAQMTCVDPLVGLDMHAIWQLLFEPERMNILHSAKQDMEVIWFEQRRLPGRLIDTQICAALLGHPAQIGYAGLTEELLGVSISKSQTRTDWSRRPLSAAQIQYALEDIEHLPVMHMKMRAQLEDKGRYTWALEDSAVMLNTSLYEPEPRTAWQRIKSMPYLPVAEQARARALAEWREERAIKSDRPRQWLLSDKALLQIAQNNPATEEALGRVQDLPRGVARNQGRKLLAVLDAANQTFADGEMQLEQLTPERDQDKTKLRILGAIVKARAEQLDLAAEVLASKRDLQALLRGDAEPRALQGWRKEIIGDELAAKLD